MASVDLKHVYYSVPIHPKQKIPQMSLERSAVCIDLFCKWTCECRHYFTKLLKPVYAHLRSQRFFFSASFIDDCDLQGRN